MMRILILQFYRLMMQPIANFGCTLLGLPTYQQLASQLRTSQRHITTFQQQQQALYRVISKIRASLDLDNIFRTATKETCKLLHAERIAVYRFSEDWGGEFIEDFEFAQPGWEGSDIFGKATVWNDSYLQEQQGGRYRNNETLVVDDIYKANLSQCHIDVLEQFHIRAYATAPIFIGTQLWGVLGAYHHSKPWCWQEIEIQFLSQVALQLGVAVKQAKLMTQAESKAKELQAANEQQKILSNLIAEIRESLDLDILFRTTVREVRKSLKTDRVGIFKFDPESRFYVGEFVAENVLPEFDSTMSIKVQDHCFGENYADQYQQGRMQVLTNVDQAGLKNCHLETLKQFQVKAQIVIPLRKEDTLWGLLCVHHCRAERQWKSTEIEFIKQLAAQFSVALSHAELLEQYRRKTKALDQIVSQLQEANQKLDDLSHVDALTQIPNRRSFDRVLAREWQHLSEHGSPLSLILFDVDHFKKYNDYYGHIMGDKALQRIARAAQSALQREFDFLARYGGEEFVVILPNTSELEALEVANRIQNAVKALKIPHHGLMQESALMTVSFGIASQIANLDQPVCNLLAQADQALYQAKAGGRDACRLFQS